MALFFAFFALLYTFGKEIVTDARRKEDSDKSV